MSTTEWYLRTTWTPEDEADFLVRLKRSRSHNRAQYLLLQADALEETGDPALAGPALGLVERMLAEYPDELFLSRAHVTRARLLLRLMRVGEALDAFRASLDARRARPLVVNYGYLEFAWAIGWRGLREHFTEALAVLEEFTGPTDVAFPVNAYRYFGALAFISYHLGEAGDAKRWATNALAAAAKGEGPFSRHPGLGTVTRVDGEAHDALGRLAGVT